MGFYLYIFCYYKFLINIKKSPIYKRLEQINNKFYKLEQINNKFYKNQQIDYLLWYNFPISQEISKPNLSYNPVDSSV